MTAKPRVLVVDDSFDDRQVVVRYLRRAPLTEYEIHEASSGAEALRIAAEVRPDVFVVDNHMGEMSGVNLLSELRDAGHRDAAVVVLTGSGGDARAFLAQGIDDFVQKDELTQSYLLRVVSNALIKASLRAQLAERHAFEERLIDMVAHDLRSPLNSIVFATQMLDADRLSDDGKKCLTTVQRSANRMSRIIEQLLDLARVRHAQGYPLQAEDLDLCELVSTVVEDVRISHTKREIEVVCQGDGSGQYDATALTQVITNLVGNAIRYGDPSQPITVRADAGDDTVALRVSNAGPPIPPESLTRLFRPFERAGREKNDRKGLGLGLYIVMAIVQAHGGEVHAESDTAATTFTVTLPRRRPMNPEAGSVA